MLRRGFLSLPLLGSLAVLAACADERDPDAVAPRPTTSSEEDPTVPAPRRIAYGDGAQQFADLHLPAGTPRGVVVVIHGGFWLAEYDYTLGTPLAESLAAEGWAALNLEYRRVGNGGGDPATFDDVAAGIDALTDLDLDLTTVVTLGHSAGGHLAAWAASRGRFDAWSGGVDVTHVVAQAGVLDLRAAAAEGLGGGAVERFLGHEPGDADDPLDPARQVPLDQPVWCVHGDADANVPLSQSQDYVDAATAAGAAAELVQVDGDHFVLIDPGSPAWARQLEILDSIG